MAGGHKTGSIARYPVPAGRVRTELKVKNSLFITTIDEARTAEAARAFIDEIRTEFSDATHNVYAFRAGYGASITEGMSDDGEPPGTAGRPALTVLRGADIGDIALVITRYFGGTKLGTGGLVRAYTESAQLALAALPLAERVERTRGMTVVPYTLYELTKRLISEGHGEILEEDFGAEITLTFRFIADDAASFTDAYRELTHGRGEIIWEDPIIT